MACWWRTAGRLPRGWGSAHRCCPGNGTKKSTGAKPDLPRVREHCHRVTGVATNGLQPLEKSFWRGYGEQGSTCTLAEGPHVTRSQTPQTCPPARRQRPQGSWRG